MNNSRTLRSVLGVTLGLVLMGCAGVVGGLAPLPLAMSVAQEPDQPENSERTDQTPTLEEGIEGYPAEERKVGGMA